VAHARRKLHDLYVNHRSEIAEEGLGYFAVLHEIEAEARELKLDADGRQQLRRQRQSRSRKPCGNGSLDNEVVRSHEQLDQTKKAI
jgi:transposase